jgi:hypothetical protein
MLAPQVLALIEPTQPADTQFEDDDPPPPSDAPPARAGVWAKLVPLAGPSAPVELSGEVVVLGRSRERGSDVVLGHPRISSRHCELHLAPGGAYLVDVSQNGAAAHPATHGAEGCSAAGCWLLAAAPLLLNGIGSRGGERS